MKKKVGKNVLGTSKLERDFLRTESVQFSERDTGGQVKWTTFREQLKCPMIDCVRLSARIPRRAPGRIPGLVNELLNELLDDLLCSHKS